MDKTQIRCIETKRPEVEKVETVKYNGNSITIQGLTPNTHYTVILTFLTTDPATLSNDAVIETPTGNDNIYQQ